MSRAKGRRTIRKAIEYLEDQGMLVDEVEMGGRYNLYKDLFAGYCTQCWVKNCKHQDEFRFEGFDLIGLQKNKVWFIQVKTNTPPLRKNYIRFAKKFATRYIHVLAMTWYDRKGWVFHRFTKSGTVNRKDLRT